MIVNIPKETIKNHRCKVKAASSHRTWVNNLIFSVTVFVYLLPSVSEYLLHHTSLSILGNAFLAPRLLAAAEKARSDPDMLPGPVF